MGAIKDNARKVLAALYGEPGLEGESSTSRSRFSGEELQDSTNLQPNLLNDAIELLRGEGLVETLRAVGTHPYKFLQVWLTAVGRASVEEHQEERTKKNAATAVILTALPVEHRAVVAHLSEIRETEHEAGTIYDVGVFVGETTTWKVSVAETGAGNEAASLECERAVKLFNPDVLFFVGVAGGVKDVSLGDVVAATHVYGYETGKDTDEGFKPRGKSHASAYRLVQRAKAVARKSDWHDRLQDKSENPSAFVGPIAAGEKVVASTKGAIFNFLRQSFSDTIAVEMEGHGTLFAAHASNCDALVVRGISDLVDGKGSADSGGSQQIASERAAAFAYEVLSKLSVTTVGKPGAGAERASNEELSVSTREVVDYLAVHHSGLIQEMIEDLQNPGWETTREVVILPSPGVTFNATKQRFSLFESKHDNLRGAIDVLENNGLIVDVTPKTTPVYRLKEEFVCALLAFSEKDNRSS